MQPEISVVVPAYNEELVIRPCHERLHKVLSATGRTFEIVFVNDGSKDQTRSILNALAMEDSHTRVIHFVRNFGHQAAITAGMNEARGDAIIVIDADLQDPPELIPEMLSHWQSGSQVVYAQRAKRAGEGFLKKLTAKLYYRFIASMSDVDLPLDVGDYRLIDRRVRDALKQMGEHNRYVRGMIAWLGFRQSFVRFDRDPRLAGETKYPIGKMMRFAVDGVTAFSRKPLQMASFLGFFTSFLGLAALVWVLYVKLFTSDPVAGWASLIGVNLLFFGLVFFVLGIQGAYIGRLYDEVKARPHYLIDEVVEKKE